MNVTKRWKNTMGKIEKLLIANRGEIACRVMRTAQRLGVKTVAVYSEADENSLHVSMADEAYKIGPPPASQSYLRPDRILDVACRAGCHAIHPGYGFLSENAQFAELCHKSGVIFVGPPASAITDMGIKSKSKEIMAKAGVPIIHGYHGQDQSVAKLRQEALKIGYPVMIKAVMGGGGKGMRIALTEGDFEEALDSAKNEAKKSFGDDVVLLEKFVTEPRHVEVQVFADTHGNAVHLFERDCSVQRRHQKIIEEAPAPGLSDDLRSELGAAAVRAAKAVGYVGAGTVEFILDRKTHSFHFMEMNTRLQVEHPITEMITGTDLVEWQLKVAAGEPLPLSQEQIRRNGHAFEARIYAEDPNDGFLPGAGVLSHLATPSPSHNVRIETGVRQGDEVSIHYDPMIAKLVVLGKNRSDALLMLQSLLKQYNVVGLETNTNFLLDICGHPEFKAGNVYTDFIRDNQESLLGAKPATEMQQIQAALAVVLHDELTDIGDLLAKRDQFNPFAIESGFRVNHALLRDLKLKHNDKDLSVKVRRAGYNTFHVSTDGGRCWCTVCGELHHANNKLTLNVATQGAKSSVGLFVNADTVAIFDEGGKTEFGLKKAKFWIGDDEADGGLASDAVASMPGVLDKILVKPGDRVKRGDSLFVLVAMKMEYIVKANRDGTVADVFFKPGDSVGKDVRVIQFEENESA